MEAEMGKMCNREIWQSFYEDIEANSVNIRPDLLMTTVKSGPFE
jgi:hypothetical protein